MSQKILNMKSLPLLADGALEQAVNHCLSVVHSDLEERHQIKKERTVTIVLTFMPNVLNPQETHLSDVRTGFTVNTSIPKYGPVQVQMVPKQQGLAFRPDVNENADQMSIADAHE